MKKDQDIFIECSECGCKFFCQSPPQNRKAYNDHLKYCTHKLKKVDLKKAAKKRKEYGLDAEPEREREIQ
jgi:hypothetical protein